LWSAIGLAILTVAALYLLQKSQTLQPQPNPESLNRPFGGPFTLTAGDGRPFSSEALSGQPYVLYFGFTRCGDACPTTLSRLVKLRREAGDDQRMKIVFITIDPTHDGPKEVGQYASLFNAPIIGLTGSQAQIEQVKKQYGIYAEPVPGAPMGKEMEHTATVLLFDGHGKFAGTISPDESDADALLKMQKLLA
jgi:protein SCO1/2